MLLNQTAASNHKFETRTSPDQNFNNVLVIGEVKDIQKYNNVSEIAPIISDISKIELRFSACKEPGDIVEFLHETPKKCSFV